MITLACIFSVSETISASKTIGQFTLEKKIDHIVSTMRYSNDLCNTSNNIKFFYAKKAKEAGCNWACVRRNYIFKADGSLDFGRPYIVVNLERFQYIRTEPGIMAFIIGHELAHVEQQEAKARVRIKKFADHGEYLNKEISADILGFQMAVLAGFSGNRILERYELITNDKGRLIGPYAIEALKIRFNALNKHFEEKQNW